jgi:hypothetical protein
MLARRSGSDADGDAKSAMMARVRDEMTGKHTVNGANVFKIHLQLT